ncbi:MAG: hypothetical protein CM1200mP16_04370 [Nitrospina sp.]|nr:MAG: hypothetical protein CM1200mP16_04370 [Nitrospina sp.]
MSDQPKEPEKTTYQRDKTAKGPQPTSDAPKIPAKPKPKIKKGFFFPKKQHLPPINPWNTGFETFG